MDRPSFPGTWWSAPFGRRARDPAAECAAQTAVAPSTVVDDPTAMPAGATSAEFGATRDRARVTRPGGALTRLRSRVPGTHESDGAAAALVAAQPGALLRTPGEVRSPVLQIILERVQAGSRPGDRSDGHTVCLAVEGGGMRGAVSAGMCVVLEAAGLVGAFDRIYGVSAGALNGWATAAGQAALGATHYQDAASRHVINRMRPLVGRPVIDLDLLFEDLIAARKPLSFERLSSGPEFRALATSLDTLSIRVLKGFADVEELMQAVRASASLPRLGGRPPVFRGERLADGGLVEPIPFETALSEGATHVLVLRTRPAGYRKPALLELGELLTLRDDPGLLDLVRARHGTYNRHADALEHPTTRSFGAACVHQVAVPERTRLVGRLESNAARVTETVGIGAAAMAAALFTNPIDLCWQPVVYRAAPSENGASEPVLPPVGVGVPVRTQGAARAERTPGPGDIAPAPA